MKKSDDSEVDIASSDVSDDDDDEFQSSGADSSDFEDDVVVKKPASKKTPAAKTKTPPAKNGKENSKPSSKRGRSTKSEPVQSAAPKKAKAAGEKAGKPAVVSDSKGLEIIKDYMLKANRPYSHLNVYDNLHGVVKKTSVPKILNQLCDEGVLQCKDFGKVRIYLANQSNFPDVNQTEMEVIDKKIHELQEKHSKLKEELKQLQSRSASLKSRPTTAELHSQVEQIHRDLTDKQNLFAQLTKADQPLISKEDFAKIKQKHLFYVKMWKQRRRACNEMLDCILENSTMKKAELEEEIGIETDAAVGVSVADHESSR